MKYLILIPLVMIIVFLLPGFSSTKAPDNTYTTVEAPFDREADYKTNFIGACVRESGMNSMCECLYTYVATNYTWDERIELDRQVGEGDIPQELNNAILNCIE